MNWNNLLHFDRDSSLKEHYSIHMGTRFRRPKIAHIVNDRVGLQICILLTVDLRQYCTIDKSTGLASIPVLLLSNYTTIHKSFKCPQIHSPHR
jgi:uncharacterized membrane protein YGL010W